jgi:hypothetical protein
MGNTSSLSPASQDHLFHRTHTLALEQQYHVDPQELKRKEKIRESLPDSSFLLMSISDSQTLGSGSSFIINCKTILFVLLQQGGRS